MCSKATYGISYTKFADDLNEKPNENFKAGDSFYHYTSLENCIKMLEHEDMAFEIWASHLSYLNDKEEHKNGLQLIGQKVKDLLLNRGDELSDWTEQYLDSFLSQFCNEIYVICFCSERNLLSQWKYYGNNSGIAIEYNLWGCEFSGFFSEKSLLGRYLRKHVQKVIYDDMEKQKIVDDFITERIYKVYDNASLSKIDRRRKIKDELDKLYGLAPLFKHNSFSEEHESRLLFMPVYNSDIESVKKVVHYRVSNGKIIPYMKIKIRGREELGERLPVIKSLTVGPGRNQDLIFDALKHYVLHKFPGGEVKDSLTNRRDYSYIKINGIEIRKSTMPFRD